MPGVQDALSAAIVHQTGFVSGYALSASLLAKPDFGLLTTTEVAGVTRNICTAVPNLPIVADADIGGGNAINVQRCIKDLIAAGAAGCFLEVKASFVRSTGVYLEDHDNLSRAIGFRKGKAFRMSKLNPIFEQWDTTRKYELSVESSRKVYE